MEKQYPSAVDVLAFDDDEADEKITKEVEDAAQTGGKLRRMQSEEGKDWLKTSSTCEAPTQKKF